MKTKTIIILLISISLALILIAGCKPIVTPVSEIACTVDSDCACGTHIDTGVCFTGNKAFVNVEKQCPDFCTGIAAMFETRCIDGECKQARIRPVAECTADSDCVPAQCCHATTCISKEKKNDCEGIACTMECRGGTLDCGGNCACEEGKCAANYANIG